VIPDLLVVGLGGNAVSPPRGALTFAGERAAIASAAGELSVLARAGARLLVVHGNGPQVGRLLLASGLGDPESLDVHVAQTQGELGYLLTEALEVRLRMPCAALVTRVVVAEDDPAFAAPLKPIGGVLGVAPADAPSVRTPNGVGFRRVVASPRPVCVVEEAAIAELLKGHHVVAGGGGGVPLAKRAGGRSPVAAVVDKDWVASFLARRLDAQRLVFVTDVDNAFEGFGGAEPRALSQLTCGEARARLARGEFAPGSMGPKMEAAVEFTEATGRPSVIAPLGGVERALRGAGGTTIVGL
jgi:carbamate kinase